VKNIKGKFMISYNDSPNIRRVFAQYNIKGISTTYSATSTADARIAKEVIITNY
jgi:putative IMPACT (imprinted ancient) family translation regulator